MESGLEQQESDKSGYEQLKPRRIKRDLSVIYEAKHGKQRCEHCSWKQPLNSSILHAHHVVPLACGGADSSSNIIVLCPNCHAIAHYVSRRTNTMRTYAGPRTILELREWMAKAKQPNELRKLQRAHMLAHVAPILAALRP